MHNYACHNWNYYKYMFIHKKLLSFLNINYSVCFNDCLDILYD